MGVPRLFPWTIKTFLEAIKHVLVDLLKMTVLDLDTLEISKHVIEVDNLYIDAPNLIHAANQQVHNYGSVRRLMDPYINLTPEEKQQKVFELIFRSLVMISRLIRPRKLLYIAIDGPAPLAKQAQQRQRRYVSAMERGGRTFDSACMTPGTLFMFELAKYLHYAIRHEIESGSWRDIEVLFSSPRVPGEGEHKLLNYIRDMPPTKRDGESHCFFGPDGDLIMLTLASHLDKMYLFREEIDMVGRYYLLDIGKIRKGLKERVMTLTPGSYSDVSNDFILLGFFVGNDFLPKIQMFMYLEDGLEFMLSKYNKLCEDATATGKKFYLTQDNRIDYVNFTSFIKALASYEPDFLLSQANASVKDISFTNHTLLRHVYETSERSTLDYAGYRKDYYQKSGIEMDIPQGEQDVMRMCADYITTIAWVFDYYVNGLPSWTHFYNWHYPPLMKDLEIYMGMQPKVPVFAKDQPSLPFVQLLCVLPRTSYHLLPKPYHLLLTSDDSPLVREGYYPKKFEIDYEGKTAKHFGIAKLPFVDVTKVNDIYRKVITKNRYERNELGYGERFVYDAQYSASYHTDYGVLEKMHVRKSNV
jgi:5'-3' exoribonuclease 1